MRDFGISKEDHLGTYVHRIERSLHKKEAEVQLLLNDTGFIFRQLKGVDKLATPQQKADLDRLLTLTNKTYNVSLYKEDSLVFWMNNRAFLDSAQLSEVRREKDFSRLIKLSNGYFEIIKKTLPSDIVAVALLPIKKEFSSHSEFLPNSFVTEDFPIPGDVYLKTSGMNNYYRKKNG